MFGLCVAFLGISFVCQVKLDALPAHGYHHSSSSSPDEETTEFVDEKESLTASKM
jgi:hypothetical protein